jgi:hypothetical protein
MRKAIVMLAVIVGLAGLQTNAEARGGNGGGGGSAGGGGMGAVSQSGNEGMQQTGDMNRYQNRERHQVQEGSQAGSGTKAQQQQRHQVQEGSQAGSGTKAQQQQRLRDPALHTTPPVATPTE